MLRFLGGRKTAKPSVRGDEVPSYKGALAPAVGALDWFAAPAGAGERGKTKTTPRALGAMP